MCSVSTLGEITLVALGPLTNVALALKIDPEFGRRLKNVTIMGGNTEGNVMSNLTHMWRMDFPILINWMSPLPFLGASGMIFHFYFIFR